MGLFDYQSYDQLPPYYSSLMNTPKYKALKKEQGLQAGLLAGIGGAFEAALSGIPVVGQLAKMGIDEAKKFQSDQYNTKYSALQKSWERSLPWLSPDTFLPLIRNPVLG